MCIIYDLKSCFLTATRFENTGKYAGKFTQKTGFFTESVGNSEILRNTRFLTANVSVLLVFGQCCGRSSTLQFTLNQFCQQAITQQLTEYPAIGHE
ncbi:MAG: hypothetical protein EAZ60_02700 [Oscillatoriales cyanobacterium]|nr:MAG: hypothetical protein EAZ83_19135 [Oscillatoriales cyanobacterium]TAE95458.1 MAG: hypothetical protein EAZ79_18935 [Oscillatoriales cyanobacterium]TAF17699.1 MAG: hypothetical protein EAZ73_20415 [Oscillatoriales cyanobacterium]TAF30895.1 MAG: hypothetical protein EAZ69_21190 [Oscillatoriales cyanobacterium]TAF58550.1 MAG: hypothetical protein EAZ60_02700 [Oscillatoriales cyanobacterium]